MGDVVEDLVGHVLADPLLPLALEADDRGAAGEVAVFAIVLLQLVPGDLNGQVGQAVVEAHRHGHYRGASAGPGQNLPPAPSASTFAGRPPFDVPQEAS